MKTCVDYYYCKSDFVSLLMLFVVIDTKRKCVVRKIVPEHENLEERDVEEWVTGDQELENETLADKEIKSVVCQQTDIDEDEIEEEKEEEDSEIFKSVTTFSLKT